jgi:hypothetical protein
MAATHNYEWNQGEDLLIALVYKSGPVGEAEPVDLNLYSFRMDIVAPNGKVLSVVNDDTIADVDPYTTGAQEDAAYEVTMNNLGEIRIDLSRALTLPGGAFYKYLNANPPVKTFSYDMFLRDNNGKQKKVMGGTITIERSVTHWT